MFELSMITMCDNNAKWIGLKENEGKVENSLKLNKIKSERKGERQLEKKNGTTNKGESVRVSGRTNERKRERAKTKT